MTPSIPLSWFNIFKWYIMQTVHEWSKTSMVTNIYWILWQTTTLIHIIYLYNKNHLTPNVSIRFMGFPWVKLLFCVSCYYYHWHQYIYLTVCLYDTCIYASIYEGHEVCHHCVCIYPITTALIHQTGTVVPTAKLDIFSSKFYVYQDFLDNQRPLLRT